MTKVILFCALLTISSISSAGCYLVGGLQGFQSSKSNNYDFVSSGFSEQEFQINVDGSRSFVVPRGREKCSEINQNAIICTILDGSKSKHEIWSLDLDRSVVIYSGHRIGFDLKVDKNDLDLDGAYVFTGKVLGKCK